MSNMLSGRGLVVFYSSTGNTKQVAESIARMLAFDIEAIREPTTRVLTVPPKGLSGFLGFMRAGFEGAAGRTVSLLTMERDPSQYSMVVVGTPVWAGNPASPARSWLVTHGRDVRQASFFFTAGDVSNAKVFPAMAAASGLTPAATLSTSADQVRKGQFEAQVEALAQELAQYR